MNVSCPICRTEFTVSDSPEKSLQLRCTRCGGEFCAATGLSFRYGARLANAEDGSPRVSCAFCHQHYALTRLPDHNLVGCLFCHEIFAIPPEPVAVPVAPRRPAPPPVAAANGTSSRPIVRPAPPPVAAANGTSSRPIVRPAPPPVAAANGTSSRPIVRPPSRGLSSAAPPSAIPVAAAIPVVLPPVAKLVKDAKK